MKKVSLSDLARELGVSKTLVSLVLNGKGNQYGINKEVQERVKEKAIELNYRPNQTARSLRSGKTYTLGLMIDDLSNTYQANIFKHIETIASQKGYNLLVSTIGESGKDKLSSIISKSVDGVIVNSNFQDESFKKLIKNGFPVVMVDHKLNNGVTNFVGLDYQQIVYSNTIHLIQKGHKEVALTFDSNSDSDVMSSCINGAHKALEESALPKSNLIVVSIDASDGGEVSNVLKELKANNPSLKAVIGTTDVLTLKLVEAIHDMGLKIPNEFSVISMVDHEVFSFMFPKVTANETPYGQLAEYTLDLLLQQMEGKKPEARSVELVSGLIERASC